MISINVTVMLVLTTMLINVSNNLPRTSYIKMIDIWLLASLTKPFFDVLLQTYIDTLRDDSQREINHHGEPRKVEGEEQGNATIFQVAPAQIDKSKLLSINEEVQRDELRKLYSKDLGRKKKAKIRQLKNVSLKVNPLVCITFVVVYWAVGLNQYNAEV